MTRIGEARGRWWREAVVLTLLTLPSATPVRGAPPAAVLRVSPARSDSALVCAVDSRGLPDSPSRETLASGLPSAIILACSVLDGHGRAVGGSRAELRIEPDLWENVFLLSTPAFSARGNTLEEVERLLAHLSPVPVLPLCRLQEEVTYRVRVRLAVEPLAPSQLQQTRSLLTGEAGLSDPNRREVSVGLDALLRFFLGRGEDETWVSEATSEAFRIGELPPSGAPTGSRGD